MKLFLQILTSFLLLGSSFELYIQPVEKYEFSEFETVVAQRNGEEARVTIILDYSDEPKLKEFGERCKSEIESWYGRIAKMLSSPGFTPRSEVILKFDKNYDGVAYYDKNRIVGSVKYYLNHQNDVGSMIHEAVHVIQATKQYNDDTSWLVEGIADYIRYYFYEPNRKPRKPSKSQSYKAGYGIAAYFLKFIEDKYNPDIVSIANQDLRNGKYNYRFWKKHTKKEVDDLWEDMQANG